jgi:integrase
LGKTPYFEPITPLEPRGSKEYEIYIGKSTSYMVEAAGIEPASANPLPSALHA